MISLMSGFSVSQLTWSCRNTLGSVLNDRKAACRWNEVSGDLTKHEAGVSTTQKSLKTFLMWNVAFRCVSFPPLLCRHVQRPAAGIPVQRSQDLHKCSNLLAKLKNDTVPGRLSEDAVNEKNEMWEFDALWWLIRNVYLHTSTIWDVEWFGHLFSLIGFQRSDSPKVLKQVLCGTYRFRFCFDKKARHNLYRCLLHTFMKFAHYTAD